MSGKKEVSVSYRVWWVNANHAKSGFFSVCRPASDWTWRGQFIIISVRSWLSLYIIKRQSLSRKVDKNMNLFWISLCFEMVTNHQKHFSFSLRIFQTLWWNKIKNIMTLFVCNKYPFIPYKKKKVHLNLYILFFFIFIKLLHKNVQWLSSNHAIFALTSANHQPYSNECI